MHSKKFLSLLLALTLGACVSRLSLDDASPSHDGAAIDVSADVLKPVDQAGVLDGDVAPASQDGAPGIDATVIRDASSMDLPDSNRSTDSPLDSPVSPDVPKSTDTAIAIDAPVTTDVAKEIDAPIVSKDGAPADAVPDLPIKSDLPVEAASKDYCSPNPCLHGTCTNLTSSYKCSCTAGWGGSNCSVGSCTNLACPSSAPCRVPDNKGLVAICYPSACVGTDGLCMAENADGSGDAVIFNGRNPSFNTLLGSNWNDRAKYFAYIDAIHGDWVCVFPKEDETGTALVIPLGEVRTRTSAFGQSNAWPNSDTCPGL